MPEDRASLISRIISRLHDEGHEPPYLFGQVSATGERTYRRVIVKDGVPSYTEGSDALEVPTIVVDAKGQWMKVEFRYPSGPPQFSKN